jgi:hypothetical protein
LKQIHKLLQLFVITNIWKDRWYREEIKPVAQNKEDLIREKKIKRKR